MTVFDIQSVAQAPVTPQAMTAAVILASRVGDAVTDGQLLDIARTHGGDALMASALQLRLSLMAMLLRADPAFMAETSELAPEAIGAVLAAFPINATPRGVDFDGDALATALRLQAMPQGAA